MPSRSVVTLFGCAIFAFSSSVFGQSIATTPLQYTPMSTPCRALDTRTTSTPVQGGTTRTVSPFSGACNISVPADGVIVYAVNVTVVPHGSLDVLTVWPAGKPNLASVCSIQSTAGRRPMQRWWLEALEGISVSTRPIQPT